ncbi:MAG: acetate kinase [Phycisphaerae bacterium]|nr:acetate kinase [Phycisphaerae bacterium]
MNILVLNCGSSSIKYQLYKMANSREDHVLASGMVERIGEKDAAITHQDGGKRTRRTLDVPDHRHAFQIIVTALTDPEAGVISDISEVNAIGHRVVHGGERFVDSCLIDDDVIAAIEDCVPLAPLHNPANLIGIRAAEDLLSEVPQVAVFDTSFHETMEPRAYLYAIPQEYHDDHRVRRYGFHGTSHRYVAGVAAEMLGKAAEGANVITAHLGNGCSITAVRGGKSVDTSMGMTPLEGLVMGTRCGDIDAAVVFHLARNLDMDYDEIDRLLNTQSGLLGLSGVSNDMREIIAAAEAGDKKAALAIEVFCYRLKKYIGAYTAVLGEVDALVFTGGIGENAELIRRLACTGLAPLGYEIDEGKNAATHGTAADISTEKSRARVLVIPTNEEVIIARDTARIVMAKVAQPQ